MLEIKINLGNSASLAPMATPAGMGAAAALPAGIPGAPGIYLIANTASNNRYAGISTNVATRFTGRMTAINELGLTTANMTPIWAWWGNMQYRQIPLSAHFPMAFPARQAGLPHAQWYALPAGAATVMPAHMPNITLADQTNALNEAARPIRVAYGAYRGWNAAHPGGGPVAPGGAGLFDMAFNAAVVFATPAGVNANTIGLPSAAAAAQAAALWCGASPAVAAQAAAAITYRVVGGPPPPPSDAGAVIHGYFGGPPLAAPAPAGPWVVHNPVAGPPTTLNAIFAGYAINLEHVFIRFVMQHLLAAGGFVSNGNFTGPLPWPGGALEPICITWHSGAGHLLGPFDRSVIWWPGTPF